MGPALLGELGPKRLRALEQVALSCHLTTLCHPEGMSIRSGVREMDLEKRSMSHFLQYCSSKNRQRLFTDKNCDVLFDKELVMLRDITAVLSIAAVIITITINVTVILPVRSEKEYVRFSVEESMSI